MYTDFPNAAMNVTFDLDEERFRNQSTSLVKKYGLQTLRQAKLAGLGTRGALRGRNSMTTMPRQLAPRSGWRLSFHVGVAAAAALAGYFCSRGMDGELLAGTVLLFALSSGRGLAELAFFRCGALSHYTAMLVASPVAVWLSMLPASSLEGMAGMLFFLFPMAVVGADVLLIVPILIVRSRSRPLS